jgi:hypothetical protein
MEENENMPEKARYFEEQIWGLRMYLTCRFGL